MTTLVTTTIRRGPRHWIRAAGAMFRWRLTSLRLLVPILILVQILVATGFSVGMSIFFTELDPVIATYLATGAAVLTLILVGLVVAPQLIADEKSAGTYEFSWSLPVPRSAAVVAWTLLCGLISLPATAVALAVAGWRLELSYDLSWTLIPAVVLVVGCGSMIGYAVGQAIESTGMIQLASQVLAFGVLGFTPITFPIENLPGWLAGLHRALPFYHMGVILRDGLSSGLVDDVGTSYLIVMAWTVLAALGTALVLGRRK